jgi:two-component system, OmpR family, sensor kinase
MASLGSSTRSAARATYSAYRSVPVRWRLAGGSAALTFVILAGFAAIVGVLTDRQVTRQFVDDMNTAIERLDVEMQPRYNQNGSVDCQRFVSLTDFANSDGAQIRVFDDVNDLLCSSAVHSKNGAQINSPPFKAPVQPGSYDEGGYRVQALEIGIDPSGEGWLIYARRVSEVDHTIARVRFFLLLGVIGGTVLALLAGLYVAQRAMRPITELTDAAREIERTRDPSRRIPHPEANDEVAELARTLEGMLGALDSARNETEAALGRQREFVADASHELRTPLTSVLANLELLTDELDGEQAESARSALRSTQRMRRLVGDLLLLARADAERARPYRPTDLADVLTDAAAELGAGGVGLDDHELTIDPGSAVVPGAADDLHRLVLNLLENAVRHTPSGTRIHARTRLEAGIPTLVVQDDGPGIPPALRQRVFERFVRGGGDAGNGARGTGLGLAIVQAVAESHGAIVALGPLSRDGQPPHGTRFEIRFAASAPAPAGEPAELQDQTSTTTGSTIGRRRSRS